MFLNETMELFRKGLLIFLVWVFNLRNNAPVAVAGRFKVLLTLGTIKPSIDYKYSVSSVHRTFVGIKAFIKLFK